MVRLEAQRRLVGGDGFGITPQAQVVRGGQVVVCPRRRLQGDGGLLGANRVVVAAGQVIRNAEVRVGGLVRPPLERRLVGGDGLVDAAQLAVGDAEVAVDLVVGTEGDTVLVRAHGVFEASLVGVGVAQGHPQEARVRRRAQRGLVEDDLVPPVEVARVDAAGPEHRHHGQAGQERRGPPAHARHDEGGYGQTETHRRHVEIALGEDVLAEAAEEDEHGSEGEHEPEKAHPGQIPMRRRHRFARPHHHRARHREQRQRAERSRVSQRVDRLEHVERVQRARVEELQDIAAQQHELIEQPLEHAQRRVAQEPGGGERADGGHAHPEIEGDCGQERRVDAGHVGRARPSTEDDPVVRQEERNERRHRLLREHAGEERQVQQREVEPVPMLAEPQVRQHAQHEEEAASGVGGAGDPRHCFRVRGMNGEQDGRHERQHLAVT